MCRKSEGCGDSDDCHGAKKKDFLKEYTDKIEDLFSDVKNFGTSSFGYTKEDIEEHFEVFKEKCWPSIKSNFESFGEGGKYFTEKAEDVLEYFKGLVKRYTKDE